MVFDVQPDTMDSLQAPYQNGKRKCLSRDMDPFLLYHQDLKLVQIRLRTKRCAEVVHSHVVREGHSVPLSSVRRVLERSLMIKKRSPWKKSHLSPKRPLVNNPGDLVQIDTIHLWKDGSPKAYIYTLIDVQSRWCYAFATNKVGCRNSLKLVKEAQKHAPFRFKKIQTDNGPEFTKNFTKRVGFSHRHSRVRKPNDNAHVERFNRTIKDECIRYLGTDIKVLNKAINTFRIY